MNCTDCGHSRDAHCHQSWGGRCDNCECEEFNDGATLLTTEANEEEAQEEAQVEPTEE